MSFQIVICAKIEGNLQTVTRAHFMICSWGRMVLNTHEVGE
jgi:hypothetical protein